MYKEKYISEDLVDSLNEVAINKRIDKPSSQVSCDKLQPLISVLCQSQSITNPHQMQTLLQKVDRILGVKESVICAYKTSNGHKIFSLSSCQSGASQGCNAPILHNFDATECSSYTLGDWTVYCLNLVKENISCFYCMHKYQENSSTDSHMLCELIIPHLLVANRKLYLQAFQFDKYQLTSREQEVVLWIIEGKDNWSISKILGVSERTIKFHNCNIYRKLGVKTKSELICLYYQSTVT